MFACVHGDFRKQWSNKQKLNQYMMIKNILCKNPWLDQKLEVYLLRKLCKTLLNIGFLKKRDSRMETIPYLILENENWQKLMEKLAFKFQSPFKINSVLHSSLGILGFWFWITTLIGVIDLKIFYKYLK